MHTSGYGDGYYYDSTRMIFMPTQPHPLLLGLTVRIMDCRRQSAAPTPKLATTKKEKPQKMAIQAPAKTSSLPETPISGYTRYWSAVTHTVSANRARPDS